MTSDDINAPVCLFFAALLWIPMSYVFVGLVHL